MTAILFSQAVGSDITLIASCDNFALTFYYLEMDTILNKVALKAMFIERKEVIKVWTANIFSITCHPVIIGP